MKVGVDYREATKEFPAGKGQYVKRITAELVKDSDIEWTIFAEQGSSIPKPITENAEVRYLPRGFLFHFALWWQTEKNLDLLYSPTSFIVPYFLIKTPFILTVMDLISWISPKGHSSDAGSKERFFGPRAFRRACRILSISENTKKDLEQYMNIDSEKIKVTHLAPSLPEKGSAKPVVDPPFILYLGSLVPRKNIDNLIKAYKLALEEKKLPPLVLAGKNLWGEDLSQLAKSLSIEEQVKFLGPVSEQEKRKLLEDAEMFVFISEYEGFGLPPLEAMSLGTPVIISDVSSLPEVVGDAGKLVDPQDLKGVADALKELDAKEENEKFSRLATERAKQFNWQKTAKKTLSAIKKCLNDK